MLFTVYDERSLETLSDLQQAAEEAGKGTLLEEALASRLRREGLMPASVDPHLGAAYPPSPFNAS